MEFGELEMLVRCKQLVEKELQSKYRILAHLEDNGKAKQCIKSTIARMEYALGIRSHLPSLEEILEEVK